MQYPSCRLAGVGEGGATLFPNKFVELYSPKVLDNVKNNTISMYGKTF